MYPQPQQSSAFPIVSDRNTGGWFCNSTRPDSSVSTYRLHNGEYPTMSAWHWKSWCVPRATLCRPVLSRSDSTDGSLPLYSVFHNLTSHPSCLLYTSDAADD